VETSDTVRLNEVDRDIAPSLPLTVIGNVPLGVELLVEIVRADEQLGLQETLEKAEAAPLGKPETENEMGFEAPDFSAALIVFWAEVPLFAALSPEFDSEKSNDCVKANHALVSALSGELFLKAFAFRRVSTVIVTGLLYCVDVCVGAVPSVV
jgi:hypothetical protein